MTVVFTTDAISVGDDLYHGPTLVPNGYVVHCYDENNKQISGLLNRHWKFEIRTEGEREDFDSKHRMIVVRSACGGTEWQLAG